MDAPSLAEKIRICKIGGRYLVFEIRDVARLRRNHDLCSILTGLTPQAPNQNLFSGLPLEVAEGDVKFLVEKGAAYVEDDAAAHLASLTSSNPAARAAYAESLRHQRRAVLQAAEKEDVVRQKHVAEVRARQSCKAGKRRTASKQMSNTRAADGSALDSPQLETKPEEPLFSDGHQPDEGARSQQAEEKTFHFALTPTTSAGLLDLGAHPASVEAPAASSALQAHLNSRGFFMTPGLRFGADLSVYPGDPFRYHAHYMAQSYDWDEEINLLDIVGSGRLATGVKKGFVFAAAQPPKESGGKSEMRTFTIEWAAI